MAFPALARPEDVPSHLLFPEDYERSKRMVARDFLYFGTVIVASVILGATLNYAMTRPF